MSADIVAKIAAEFPSFGGGRDDGSFNPIAAATKERPAMFAMGADIREVVERVLSLSQKHEPAALFQAQVREWVEAAFGADVADDKTERVHRFVEEALELAQSLGCTDSEAHQLVGYVFGRDAGDPAQEVGGTMTTLAALCSAVKLDMAVCGTVELARCHKNIEKIRSKQAAKPKHSPMPGPSAQDFRSLDSADLDAIWKHIEMGWHIEDRAYFEKMAPQIFAGDRPRALPLIMAIHHMWKRGRKDVPMAELLSLCKCGVHVTVNQHRDYYETAAQALQAIDDSGEQVDIEPGVRAEMIKLDTIVHVQAYPDTPIGSYSVYHYDLDEAMQAVLAAVKAKS